MAARKDSNMAAKPIVTPPASRRTLSEAHPHPNGAEREAAAR